VIFLLPVRARAAPTEPPARVSPAWAGGSVARTWIVIDLGGPARPSGELLPSSPAGPDDA